MNMRAYGRPRAGRTLALGLCLALAALPAAAQIGPLTSQSFFFDQASNAHSGNYLDAQAGLIYTDNVDLTPHGSGDTLALLGLAADTSRQGSRLDYRLDSDIALVKYLRESFKTRPFGYLDGSAELKILPGFFSWTARETYTDAVISPTEPVTPNNLEGINYVTTGPRFTLRPTLRTTITVNGTYSYIDSSSQSPLYVNIDNHRYEGDARINEALSNTASLYLGGMWQKVAFTDQAINTNFTEEDGFVGYRFTDGRTVLSVSGGYTKLRIGPALMPVVVIGGQVRLKEVSESPSGGTYNFELSRVISPTQRVSFHALQQVADTANLFRLNVDQPVATTVPDRIATGDPFTDREFGVNWRFQAPRTALEIALLDISERYKLDPTASRDVKVVSALFARQLSPVLNWDVGVDYEHQTFAFGGSNDQVNVLTSVRWQLGRQLGLRFIYAHSTLSPHGYSENQIGVTVSYALIGAAQAPNTNMPLVAPGMLPTSPMSSQFPAQFPPQSPPQ